jgi:hypothetical protein
MINRSISDLISTSPSLDTSLDTILDNGYQNLKTEPKRSLDQLIELKTSGSKEVSTQDRAEIRNCSRDHLLKPDPELRPKSTPIPNTNTNLSLYRDDSVHKFVTICLKVCIQVTI